MTSEKTGDEFLAALSAARTLLHALEAREQADLFAEGKRVGEHSYLTQQAMEVVDYLQHLGDMLAAAAKASPR